MNNDDLLPKMTTFLAVASDRNGFTILKAIGKNFGAGREQKQI